MKTALLASAIAFALAAPAAAVNLLANGSFESGGFGPGWSQFGDTSFSGVAGGIFFNPPTDGSFQAFFGPVSGFGGITQTVSHSGGSFVVSFDIGQAGGAGNYVDFGGSTILSNIADTGGAWTHYSFTVSAGANPTLTFGFFNPPSYYVLDNVSIAGVPEAATWAMMIAGFGLVGAAMRRRSAALAA